MAARQRWEQAKAGIVAVLATGGCLGPNPKFVEPTESGASDSLGASTTPGDPTDTLTSQTTTGLPMTDGGSSGAATMTITTGSMTETTGASPLCGNMIVELGEECDDGPMNDDEAACTSTCKMAVCGDGLLHMGVEYCEDLNDDPADGCVGCFVPHVCKEVQAYAPEPPPTGIYLLDPDANGPGVSVPVFCDMDLKGGGWTRIERSPLADPIGKALFVDFEVNYDDPTNSRYRMPRLSLEGVVIHSNEIWIDCGGDDHLWVDGNELFAGEYGPLDCFNISPVTYKEAELNGKLLTNVELCTGFTGKLDDGCPGAWRVDESEQMVCGFTSAPWDPNMSMMESVLSADLFATDALVTDSEVHDCHQFGAVRSILMR